MLEEGSPAQSTVKRLIEAEERAREILKAAEEHANETKARAQEQAKQCVEAVRQEMDDLLRSKLQEAESNAATEMKSKVDEVDREGREFDRRGKQHFSEAVKVVVDWITSRGD